MIMEGQNRARASSTGQISNVHPSHSPSTRQFPDHTSQLDLDPTLNSSNFATGNFDTGIISSSPPTDLHYHFIEGSAQFDQNVVLSNGFNDQNLDQPLQSNGLAMELQRTPSALAMHPSPHQFRADMLGSSPTNPFEEFAHQHASNKSAQQFGSGFLINSEFHPGMQPQHSSINPADIMNSIPSPHNIVPSASTLMPPEAHSSRQGSPAPPQGQFYSPNHSRHTSLDPSSAISAHNHQLDWAGLAQRAQSQGHRRAPSDHSDVSSSVAPSPFLGQTEAFDLDYSPSPLMNPLQDNSLYPGLGMEQISLSDPQQTHQQQQRMSPGHTPFDSPRMSPHMGLGVPTDNFLLTQDFGGSFAGGPGPDIYTNQPDPFSHLNPRHDSTDMGQAAQMTPQINVELAPPTKQPGLEPSQTDNDLDTLSPPARGEPRDSSLIRWMLICFQVGQTVHGQNQRLSFLGQAAHAQTRPISPLWTQGDSSANSPSLPLTHLSPPISRVRTLRSEPLAARPHRPFPPATTSWNSPIRTGPRRPGTTSGCRSILLPFNVPCASSASPARTIFDLIFGLIPTSALLSAPSAARRLPASMTGSDTRVCTAGKRSLCARATWGPVVPGAVGDGLRVPMLSGVISDPKRVASALNRCWTRRRWSGSEDWSSRC